MSIQSVAVFCGSSVGNQPVYIEAAQQLGKYLVDNNLHLVYGGGKVGLMGVVAEQVIRQKGYVVGVIPHFLNEKEGIAYANTSELYVTHSMHERKVLMYEKADAFVVLPGGFGTLDELFEISTWAQLGLHAKPIALWNIQGYYTHLIAHIEQMVQARFLSTANSQLILHDTDLHLLFDKIYAHQRPDTAKWMDNIVL
jgi:uncharacterized protein (TIGR00730 family)